MMYTLSDLLTKMGTPEVQEKHRIDWYYFDSARNAIAGFAKINLFEGGAVLVAELKHVHNDFEDDNGKKHSDYAETFYMHAERVNGRDQYRVTKIAFDGEEYAQPAKAVIELGLSIFHSRAMDISVRMVEQAFNKKDILEPVAKVKATAEKPAMPPKKKAVVQKRISPRERAITPREGYGVVIPFRPRDQVARAS